MQKLKQDTLTFFANCGLDYGPNKVNRLCVEYVGQPRRNGFTFAEFITTKVHLRAEQHRAALANPDLHRRISYADPTGETAVNKVTRERGMHG